MDAYARGLDFAAFGQTAGLSLLGDEVDVLGLGPAPGDREAKRRRDVHRAGAQDYCRGAGCGSCPPKILSNSGLSNGASAVSASANAKFAARNPSFAPQS